MPGDCVCSGGTNNAAIIGTIASVDANQRVMSITVEIVFSVRVALDLRVGDTVSAQGDPLPVGTPVIAGVMGLSKTPPYVVRSVSPLDEQDRVICKNGDIRVDRMVAMEGLTTRGSCYDLLEESGVPVSDSDCFDLWGCAVGSGDDVGASPFIIVLVLLALGLRRGLFYSRRREG